MSYDYEWMECTVTSGALNLRLRTARNFQTQQRANERAALPFGSVLWPAALVLADALTDDPSLVADRRTLELGCGLGLGAIVAAKLGARETLATDGHPDMPDMYKHNAEQNGVTPRYTHYDWRTPETLGRFDAVLASDVLYEPEACTLLADAIVHTLDATGTALVTDPGRPHWPRFLKKLEARDLRYDDARRHVGQVSDPGLQAVLQMHPTAKRNHHVLRIWRA